MKLHAIGRSDKGRIRPHNEDAHLVEPGHGLFAVADGMGGHAAGEVASRLAIEAVRDMLSTGADGGGDEGVDALLRRAIQEANRRIAETIRNKPEYYGMGTTLVIGLVEQDRLWIAHVGDSRAYLLRDGSMKLLTSDHSLVNELVRLGILSREKAASDPRRNVVTRALGSGASVVPDVSQEVLLPGDVLLLCSDGLNTMVPDPAIESALASGGQDLEATSAALVDAANEAGGEDNVTVVLVGPAAQDDEAAARESSSSGSSATPGP